MPNNYISHLNIENSRIELRGIVLPVQMGGLLGGPKGMLAPPLKLLGGGPGPPWPPLFLRLCHQIDYNNFQLYNPFDSFMHVNSPVTGADNSR